MGSILHCDIYYSMFSCYWKFCFAFCWFIYSLNFNVKQYSILRTNSQEVKHSSALLAGIEAEWITQGWGLNQRIEIHQSNSMVKSINICALKSVMRSKPVIHNKYTLGMCFTVLCTESVLMSYTLSNFLLSAYYMVTTVLQDDSASICWFIQSIKNSNKPWKQK